LDFTPFKNNPEQKPYNTGMASWIIHLRIAENLLGWNPNLNAEKFALGSVAPDSGKPDENWEVFTPSTEITHFDTAENYPRRIADLDFYRRYLAPLRGTADTGLISFRTGYFFHLITDSLWSKEIGMPTHQRFEAEFTADKAFIWEVKKDWYGLDFIYLRDHTDCLFWSVFRTALPDRGGLDFLIPESLAWSVNHIQQYYQRTDTEVQALYNRPYIYLSAAQADGFVEASTRQISRIYKQLWIDGMPADGLVSALDLKF
jgi:hypothetical protein